jgi:hypothetical protein
MKFMLDNVFLSGTMVEISHFGLDLSVIPPQPATGMP